MKLTTSIPTLIAAATLGFALFCCSSTDEGSSGGAPGTPAGAKSLFVANVCPSITPTCENCHKKGQRGAPVFMGANCDATYTAVEGFPGLISAPGLSPLAQKGPHSGPALTADQDKAITEWLKAEVEARKLEADDGTPKNLRAAFKAFGACMDYKRWIDLKLNTLAGVTTDNNAGQCGSCHNFGQGSLFLSAKPEETFLKMRAFPYVQRLVIGSVNPDGTFERIQHSNRILDKGNEAQQPQANNHPRYSLPSELKDNLATFVNQTISNMNAGSCDNVTLPDAGADATH